MKKIFGLLSAVIISLMLICGCSSGDGNGGVKLSAEDKYIGALNAALVSFSDCANELSSSLQQIADTTAIPSDSQLDVIAAAGEKLSEACSQIQAIEAPEKYAQADLQLDNSMRKFSSALQKCTELLNFYREFDSKIREYDAPVQGRKKLEPQAQAIYNEFATLLQQATSEFKAACESIKQIRNP